MEQYQDTLRHTDMTMELLCMMRGGPSRNRLGFFIAMEGMYAAGAGSAGAAIAMEGMYAAGAGQIFAPAKSAFPPSVVVKRRSGDCHGG